MSRATISSSVSFPKCRDAGTTPLDTLWGFYFATGSHEPILRIITVLAWAKDSNNVERLTIGSMAKLSLATNASRD